MENHEAYIKIKKKFLRHYNLTQATYVINSAIMISACSLILLDMYFMETISFLPFISMWAGVGLIGKLSAYAIDVISELHISQLIHRLKELDNELAS